MENTEFNPSAGERIDLSMFKTMRKSFEEFLPGGTQANYFGKHCYDALLSLPGCVGIRSYHGLNGDGQIKHMLVAVNADNKAISDEGGPVIFEVGQPCPPSCTGLEP